MDAVEFLKEWRRMCIKNVKCELCELYKKGICVDDKNPSDYNNDELIKLVKIVEKWNEQHPKIILTEQQKTAIKGRIAEGNLWATVLKGISIVYFSKEKPIVKKDGIVILADYYTTGDRDFYNFIEDETVVFLPDLL